MPRLTDQVFVVPQTPDQHPNLTTIVCDDSMRDQPIAVSMPVGRITFEPAHNARSITADAFATLDVPVPANEVANEISSLTAELRAAKVLADVVQRVVDFDETEVPVAFNSRYAPINQDLQLALRAYKIAAGIDGEDKQDDACTCGPDEDCSVCPNGESQHPNEDDECFFCDGPCNHPQSNPDSLHYRHELRELIANIRWELTSDDGTDMKLTCIGGAVEDAADALVRQADQS